MDYATYKKIRAYCWQDLNPFIDTKFNNDTLDLQRVSDGRLEPVTPNGTAPAEPLEPWQAAELWAQTRAAVAEYAFFISEREAVGLLALVAEERLAPTPAPVKDETIEERRARWLKSYGKGERGALQRTYERELLTNPNADRSYMGKQIKKAKQEKGSTEQGAALFGQLMQDRKRIN